MQRETLSPICLSSISNNSNVSLTSCVISRDVTDLDLDLDRK